MTSDNSKGDDMNKQRILAISDLSMMTGGFGLAVDEDVKFAPNVHPLPDPPENKERRAKAQMARAEIEEEIKALIDEINSQHVYIDSVGGDTRITHKVWSEVTQREEIEFISPKTFKGLSKYAGKGIKDARNNRTVPIAAYWLECNEKNAATSVIFEPSTTERYVIRDGKRYLNLWEGFTCQPEKGCWKLTLKHIYTVLCNRNPEYFKYVVRWLAWMVQNPHKHAEVALVLRGEKGSGKSFLFRQFKKIFGVHGMQISDPNRLTGRFNSHLRALSFLFCDEVYYPGKKDVEGIIKARISEEFIDIERKFGEPESIKNRLHIVMCTNNEWVIPATKDERRYFIETVSDRYAKGKMPEWQRVAYFKRLFDEMDSGGREAMLYDLLNMDLDGFHPREFLPETDELKKQVERTQDKINREVIEAIKDLIVDGRLPYDEDYYRVYGEYVVVGNNLWKYLFPDVAAKAVDMTMNDAAKQDGGMQERMQLRVLKGYSVRGGDRLKELGVEKRKAPAKLGKNNTLWVFPERDKMRTSRDRMYGRTDWYTNENRDADNARLEAENKERLAKGETVRELDTQEYDKWAARKSEY